MRSARRRSLRIRRRRRPGRLLLNDRKQPSLASLLRKTGIRRADSRRAKTPKTSFLNELVEPSEADEAAAEGEEGFVDVGAAFVADEQSFHLVEPAEGAFDDPAVAAEAGAVAVVAVGEHGCDPALAERLPMLVGAVAAVAEQHFGSPPWSAGEAGDRRHTVEQRQQLGDVVAVAAGQRPGQRCPVRVGQEVVL